MKRWLFRVFANPYVADTLLGVVGFRTTILSDDGWRTQEQRKKLRNFLIKL
jgi:hypothetical protein